MHRRAQRKPSYDLSLEVEQLIGARLHLWLGRDAPCQAEEQSMVTRFGAPQVVVELHEVGRQRGGSHHAQAFAAPRFDDPCHEQAIDEHGITPRRAADLFQELVHVLVLVVGLQGEPARRDHAEDAVKMLELFPSELDQRFEQRLAIRILDHEGHARRRRLALARGVIQQKCIEITENDVQPGGRSGNAQIQHSARTLRASGSRANEAMPASAGTHRRIAISIIRRRNGDYFVHQRLASKRQYPSLFGVGAGGSCEPGELPEIAAARELEEETGLSGTLKPLFELEYREPGTVHQLFVFEIATEASPGHDASEWQWSGWLTPAELTTLADTGKLCPDTEALLRRYWELERN